MGFSIDIRSIQVRRLCFFRMGLIKKKGSRTGGVFSGMEIEQGFGIRCLTLLGEVMTLFSYSYFGRMIIMLYITQEIKGGRSDTAYENVSVWQIIAFFLLN
jgi:hypothetical protein